MTAGFEPGTKTARRATGPFKVIIMNDHNYTKPAGDLGSGFDPVAIGGGVMEPDGTTRGNWPEPELEPPAPPPYHWLDSPLERAQSTVQHMLSTPAPPADYLIEGLIETGTVGVAAGATKAGKSYFLTELSMFGSQGLDVFGWRVSRPFPVVYLNGEDPARPFHWRVQAIKNKLLPPGTDALPNFYPLLLSGEPKLSTEMVQGALVPRYDVVEALAEQINQIEGEPGLIVIDTLARFHGGLETNEPLAMFVSVCERLAKLTGYAVLIVHHVSQNAATQGKGTELEAVRGATALVSNTRWHIGFQTMTKDESKTYGIDDDCRRNFVRVGSGGANYGPSMNEFWVQRCTETGVLTRDDTLKPVPKDKASQPALHDAIVAAVAEDEQGGKWHTKSRFAKSPPKGIDAGDRVLREAIEKLLTEKRLYQIPLPEQCKGDLYYHNVRVVLSAALPPKRDGDSGTVERSRDGGGTVNGGTVINGEIQMTVPKTAPLRDSCS